VRIYTVGIGKPEGTTVNVDGWSMRVRLDEDTLKRVASITQAEYFRAADASQLKKIYNALSMHIGFEKQRPVEITALVAALGALLATLPVQRSRCSGSTGFCSLGLGQNQPRARDHRRVDHAARHGERCAAGRIGHIDDGSRPPYFLGSRRKRAR
jgi:hypothetical protein